MKIKFSKDNYSKKGIAVFACTVALAAAIFIFNTANSALNKNKKSTISAVSNSETKIKDKLLGIARMVCDEAKVDFDRTRVYITGSITSNTFTPTADIDMHFRLLYTIREFAEMT